MNSPPIVICEPNQEALYAEAVDGYGAAIVRLAQSYEADPDLRQDLIQEIHLALWQSFARFAGGCSVRTWVYRVAHNTAASHVIKARRHDSRRLVSLDALDLPSVDDDAEVAAERQLLLDELSALVRQLKPLDRQITVMYLDGLEASSIAEVTGITAGNIATKIHRIKKILAARARQRRTP